MHSGLNIFLKNAIFKFFNFRSAACAIFPWCWMDSMKVTKHFCQSCNTAIGEFDQKQTGPLNFKPKWKLPNLKF